MSLRDYLHEKAEESRHNETQAYMLIIVGVILFSVGSLETIMATDSPNWFLIIPYCITPSPVHLFGLFFTLAGLGSMMSGGILGVKYRLDRAQYLDELKELQSTKELCQTEGNAEPQKLKESKSSHGRR